MAAVESQSTDMACDETLLDSPVVDLAASAEHDATALASSQQPRDSDINDRWLGEHTSVGGWTAPALYKLRQHELCKAAKRAEI